MSKFYDSHPEWMMVYIFLGWFETATDVKLLDIIKTVKQRWEDDTGFTIYAGGWGPEWMSIMNFGSLYGITRKVFTCMFHHKINGTLIIWKLMLDVGRSWLHCRASCQTRVSRFSDWSWRFQHTRLPWANKHTRRIPHCEWYWSGTDNSYWQKRKCSHCSERIKSTDW